MKKRGQVTIFVIIALLIVVSFVIVTQMPKIEQNPEKGTYLQKTAVLDTFDGVTQSYSTLTSDDDILSLEIPSGVSALREDGSSIVQIAAAVEDASIYEGALITPTSYDLKPDGATFNPPITLKISYNDSDLPEGLTEEEITLSYYSEGEWIAFPSSVDLENNLVTAEVSHFTNVALTNSPWIWREGCSVGYWVNANTGESAGTRPQGAPESKYVTGELVPWGADETGLRPCEPESGEDTWRCKYAGEYCGSNSHCCSGSCDITNRQCIGGDSGTSATGTGTSTTGRSLNIPSNIGLTGPWAEYCSKNPCPDCTSSNGWRYHPGWRDGGTRGYYTKPGYPDTNDRPAGAVPQAPCNRGW